MATIGRKLKSGVAAAATAAVLLSGCADGNVEVGGRLLDTLGISTAALNANSRAEPKLAPRAPLVLPPSTKALPEPGSAPSPQQQAEGPGGAAWPKDKDQLRVASAKDKELRQAEYCRDGNWKERAVDNDFGGTQGPQGTCGSIFNVIGGFFGGSSQKPDPMEGGIR